MYAKCMQLQSEVSENPLSMRFLECDKSSSPATSSIKRVEKTLINSMFSLFFCVWVCL